MSLLSLNICSSSSLCSHRKLISQFSRTIFGSSLVESGEALKSMADLKYVLDDNVKQNYLELLHQLQSKDLKEVAHHRKKLQVSTATWKIFHSSNFKNISVS